ncbi:hypothetical protein AAGW05_00975 [Arthrobacter sp. LAPM80]|uniref:hypothetical protein n=1 Tax=Arthrobacter sp. LAPM80 TaxID=3141788 RepID=UPI00398A6939
MESFAIVSIIPTVTQSFMGRATCLVRCKTHRLPRIPTWVMQVLVFPLRELCQSVQIRIDTPRKWLATPFIGIDNFVEAITQMDLLRSIWISVSFDVIATVVTVPLAVPSSCDISDLAHAAVIGGSDRLAHDASARRNRQQHLWQCGPGSCTVAKGPVALAFLLATPNHINNFTMPFVLFGAPAPADVNVLSILVYGSSFKSFRFGLSAAMAVVSLILIAIPLFTYLGAVMFDVADEGGKK